MEVSDVLSLAAEFDFDLVDAEGDSSCSLGDFSRGDCLGVPAESPCLSRTACGDFARKLEAEEVSTGVLVPRLADTGRLGAWFSSSGLETGMPSSSCNHMR